MKIRTFLQALNKSISSPMYYVDVLNAPFKFSLLFFLTSYLLLSAIATMMFIQFDVPTYQRIFDETAVNLQQHFPESLQIVWDGSSLTSNAEQPIEIPYPENVPKESLPAALAYISPATTDSNQLESANLNSIFVFGKEKLFVSQTDTGWSEISLQETPGFEKPFEINQSTLPAYIDSWKNTFNSIKTGLTVLYPFAFFLGMTFLRIFSLMLNGAFIYFLLLLIGKALPYMKIVQMCLHIVVVAEIVNVLTSKFTAASQLDMFGLTFWLYLTIVLLSLWNVKSIILMKVNQKN